LQLVRPDTFFARVGRDGLIGFGEAYMAGDWTADDPAAVLTAFAARMDRLVPKPLQSLRRSYVASHPASDRRTGDNSRSNIARHYDLSNELFAQFLDPTMTYSSAWFSQHPDLVGHPPTSDDLEKAQVAKIERLLDRVGVGEGTRLLEIGSGWGELAIRAARRGAQVTSITLSQEQQALVRDRVAEADLADRVQVRLEDFRAVRGTFDAVVSVEMIEAVGIDHLPEYFATIARVLAPGGRVGVQAITMPHHRVLATRDTFTWVHKYIFPGGQIPSIEAIESAGRAAGLGIEEDFRFGAHYDHTLRLWQEQFTAHVDQVRALGFDDTFVRMWEFYLAYSRAGFASGYLDVRQLVLVKGR
jgi:cyclopropane-fatty-acyl-phospholipid synthase